MLRTKSIEPRAEERAAGKPTKRSCQSSTSGFGDSTLEAKHEANTQATRAGVASFCRDDALEQGIDWAASIL